MINREYRSIVLDRSFPWLMILATFVFVPPGRIRGLFATEAPPATIGSNISAVRKRLTSVALAVFVLVQVLVPLRHFLIPGNPNWNEEGHYFAWHMMLRGKVPAVRYMATDPKPGRTGVIPLDPYGPI